MPQSAAIQREKMLQSQILTGHVLDARILDALANVARENFVPEAFRGAAYADEGVPLGEGRHLMEPLAFARFLKYAEVSRHDTVLDIGCATGYSSAVISRLAQKVVALEEDDALAAHADTQLARYANVECVHGPLAQGVRNRAPYDVIFIEGAIEHLPAAIADQLKEAGKILAVEHDEAAKPSVVGLGKLVEYRKLRGNLFKTIIRDASVPLLLAFKKPASFTF